MRGLLLVSIFSILVSAMPLTSHDTTLETQTHIQIPFSIGNVSLSNGINVFYREAGDPTKPTVLLLHGYPASSFQFRNLIPLLSPKYHVIAPDYPGFGFTTVPDSLNYTYTFDNIAATIGSFLDAKHITKFTPYLFDYGAPVGFRIALQRPEAISAIITQNGNAYVQGFGQEIWAPIFALWNATTPSEVQSARDAIRKSFFNFNGVLFQYQEGAVDPSVIEPEAYWLDYALLERPGNADIQLDLFRDYANNVKMYPAWQAYLRNRQPKTLVAWGKNDVSFVPAGAEAFKQDVPNAEFHLLNAGHFLLETNLVEMTNYVLGFLERSV